MDEQGFAKRLKELREKRKYTQSQLAKMVGISLRSIQNYEQNLSKPITAALLEIAKVLDVTPEYLLLGEDNMQTYTMAIKNELIQLKDLGMVAAIKNEELNSTILSHLEMSDDLVDDIKSAWNSAGMFTKFDKDGNGKKSYCTRNYVMETIIRYCQNRTKYKTLFKLKDGMLLGIENDEY